MIYLFLISTLAYIICIAWLHATHTRLVKAAKNTYEEQLKHARAVERSALRDEAIDQLELWKKNASEQIRKETLAKKVSIDHGFSAENFAPLLMGLNHKDFRHLGDPIDYLVFVGADTVRSNLTETIKEILILDIKTGKSDLNSVQRRIRDAVVENRVTFAVYNPDTKQIRRWSATRTTTQPATATKNESN